MAQIRAVPCSHWQARPGSCLQDHLPIVATQETREQTPRTVSTREEVPRLLGPRHRIQTTGRRSWRTKNPESWKEGSRQSSGGWWVLRPNPQTWASIVTCRRAGPTWSDQKGMNFFVQKTLPYRTQHGPAVTMASDRKDTGCRFRQIWVVWFSGSSVPKCRQLNLWTSVSLSLRQEHNTTFTELWWRLDEATHTGKCWARYLVLSSYSIKELSLLCSDDVLSGLILLHLYLIGHCPFISAKHAFLVRKAALFILPKQQE